MIVKIFSILLLSTSVPGGTDSLNMRLIGRWPFGPSYAVTGEGNYLYLGSGGGIYILDINSSPLKKIKEFTTPGEVKGLLIKENYLYVADGEAGLRIINISNPEEPKEIGYFITAAEAEDIWVEGNYAYVVAGYRGLRIIDISDPKSPKRVSYYNSPGHACNVFVSENHAYIADRYGFGIVNVSDPKNPVEIAYYDRIYAYDIYVSEKYAYIALGTDGLIIMDITDPKDLKKIGEWNISFFKGMKVVFASEKYVYAALAPSDNTAQISIIDVSDPTNPIELGSWGDFGTPEDIFLLGNYLYLAAGPNGLWIVDISDPSNLLEVENYSVPRTEAITVVKNYVYLANGGLRIIDISNPADPIEIGHSSTMVALDLFISGNYVYVANSYFGITIFNVSNPSNLYQVGRYYDTVDFSAKKIWIKGDYAYVGGYEGFFVIDISNPCTPVKAGSCPIGNAEDMWIEGDYVYITTFHGELEILNISNPKFPKKVNHSPILSGPSKICIYGDYAYITSWSEVAVVDISVPSSPTLIAQWEQGCEDISVISEDLAYVAHWERVEAWDISNLKGPDTIGYYNFSLPIWRILGMNNHIYVVHREDGFSVLEYFESGVKEEKFQNKPGDITISPNPFSQYTVIDAPKDENLEIYDSGGRLITEINPGIWDGTDKRGRRLPPGVYFCFLKSKNYIICKKIILLK